MAEGSLLGSVACIWHEHITSLNLCLGFTSGKEFGCQCRRHKRCRFDPWVRKIPWKRAWQLFQYYCLENHHGQRSLVGYSPWGWKESDMTEPPLSPYTQKHVQSLLKISPQLRTWGLWNVNNLSQEAQLVKNPPAMLETPVWLLGWEDPLEKG